MSFRLSPPGLQTEVHGWVETYGNWKQIEISEYIGYIYIGYILDISDQCSMHPQLRTSLEDNDLIWSRSLTSEW
jgi:hypothetical protein